MSNGQNRTIGGLRLLLPTEGYSIKTFTFSEAQLEGYLRRGYLVIEVNAYLSGATTAERVYVQFDDAGNAYVSAAVEVRDTSTVMDFREGEVLLLRDADGRFFDFPPSLL